LRTSMVNRPSLTRPTVPATCAYTPSLISVMLLPFQTIRSKRLHGRSATTSPQPAQSPLVHRQPRPIPQLPIPAPQLRRPLPCLPRSTPRHQIEHVRVSPLRHVLPDPVTKLRPPQQGG